MLHVGVEDGVALGAILVLVQPPELGLGQHGLVAVHGAKVGGLLKDEASKSQSHGTHGAR